MSRLLVLGGTVDGRRLARQLANRGYTVTLSVATEHGLAMATQIEPAEESGEIGPPREPPGSLKFRQGRLDQAGIAGLLRSGGFSALVDASHPYAVQVSRNAQVACDSAGLPYVRYERPQTSTEPLCADNGAPVLRVPDPQTALARAREMPGRIFLATGANQAELWAQGIDDQNRLVIRILPVPEVLAHCLSLGFTADRIIAMQGPFGEGMNCEHFRWARADILVTKDGGREGGTLEKLSAAAALGMTTILIGRPAAPDPDGLSSLAAVLERIGQILGQGGT